MRSQTLIAAGIAGCALASSTASPAAAAVAPATPDPAWLDGAAAVRPVSLAAGEVAPPAATRASPRRLGVRVKRLDVAG